MSNRDSCVVQALVDGTRDQAFHDVYYWLVCLGINQDFILEYAKTFLCVNKDE